MFCVSITDKNTKLVTRVEFGWLENVYTMIDFAIEQGHGVYINNYPDTKSIWLELQKEERDRINRYISEMVMWRESAFLKS